MALAVEQLWNHCGPQHAWWVALGIQAFAWTGQVGVGHRLVERNSPSMATAFSAASVILSPLLAFYDAVWAVGGRQPLRRQVERLVLDAQ